MNAVQSFPFKTAMLIAIALHAWHAGAAATTVPQCLAAYERSIERTRQNRLLEARAELLICASDTCPDDVRRECSGRIDEVNASIPSIVFEAKDAAGNDLSAVTVTLDGQKFADRLDGTSLAVDPGPRTFVFETKGAAPVRKQFVLARKAKDRRELITFEDLGAAPAAKAGGEATAEDKQPGGELERTLGWTAAGVGAVGLAVGTFFQVRRASKLSDRDELCPGSVDCAPGTQARIDALTEEARSASTISAVSLIAGGVLVTGGLALVLTAPRARTSATLAPIVTPQFRGLAVTGHVW
jgi:hypothetical protein